MNFNRSLKLKTYCVNMFCKTDKIHDCIDYCNLLFYKHNK